VASLDGGEPTRVIPAETAAAYAGRGMAHSCCTARWIQKLARISGRYHSPASESRSRSCGAVLTRSKGSFHLMGGGSPMRPTSPDVTKSTSGPFPRRLIKNWSRWRAACSRVGEATVGNCTTWRQTLG
jgi:hypothetical protein